MKRKYLTFVLLTIMLLGVIGCGKKEEKHIDENNKLSEKVKSVSNIKIAFSDDYKYFNNTIDELSRFINNYIIIYEHDIKEQKSCDGEREDYPFCYKFSIGKYDELYLLSDNEAMTKRIELHGKTYDTTFAGSMIMIPPSIYVKDLDEDIFKDEINSTFLASENVSKTYGANYVYSHIKFEWTAPDYDFILSFSATPYINQEEYSLTDEYKESVEKEIKFREELERKEKEEAEKYAKEEATRLKAKNRTFTAGNYKVGENIESGTYNIIAVSGRGNVYIPLKVNESFRPGGGSIYIAKYNNVELEDGDSIKISGTIKVRFEATK